uniref:CUB domain containing protein 1a n=1 Tax=Anabas testudineus TaxID=64144 RepID=A0A3Q1JHY0_ANATE
MSLSTARVSLQLCVFCFLFSLFFSGAQQMTVTLDKATTVNISSSDKRCTVCKVTAGRRQCGQSLLLKDTTSVSLLFDCSGPQDVFKIEIVRNIGKSSFDYVLLNFKRTFTWNLKASALTSVKIDFTKTGLRQIHPSEICPDRHTYTLQVPHTTGSVTIGKFCRGGLISNAQILNHGSFSLEVPAGQKLQNGQFDVSVGEDIKCELLKIFIFPDDSVMQWYFQVPDKHKTSVQFLNLTQPHCLKNKTTVEYHSKGRLALVQSLTDPQPDQNWGNVSLTLRNCEMDRRKSGSPRLSVNLKVSSSSTSLPGLYIFQVLFCCLFFAAYAKNFFKVEFSSSETVCSFNIPHVFIDLSFEDCSPQDIQVTATRVIVCKELKECPQTPVPLLVPVLPSCLPAPLTSATWTFRPPQQGTVELASPNGPLRQSLPGLPCNDSILIKLTEGNGSTIGDFCPQGAIEKIQIHANMSVTVSSMDSKAILTHISSCPYPERYIITVAAKKDTPVLLATPGWPVGMKGYSTVSWIVSVPPNMEAHLMFANLTQPKCSNQHTDISVQRIGQPALDYSRREDEEAESELNVSSSFYLNMSNCRVERGRFNVITKITLQVPKNKTMLIIILSVVAAVLVVSIIKKMNPQTSIYNPNGTNVLPGNRGFPKTGTDNESPVYATIDETLIYTHLLKEDTEFNTGADDMEVGVYRPFQAPPLPDRPRSRPLVDNEIYQAANESEEAHSVNLGPRRKTKTKVMEQTTL